MPQNIELREFNLEPGTFVIGETRSGKLLSNFNATPHLLVAGQTGGGKSTFIRQWITTLYFSNPDYRFTMIDLKGGLEFQTFEKLKRMDVFGCINAAIKELDAIGVELEMRMSALKKYQAKDLDDYKRKCLAMESTKTHGAPEKFDRRIVVIDEAAELFLSGGDVSSSAAQRAREVVSKIARQGRAVGIHLVIGTQRPDSRALDTQVKANLTGKICFQMSDIHSSLVVLGNARAKDLPPIAGRAVWQSGGQHIEIQVPYLSIERAELLLTPAKVTSGKDGVAHET